MADKTISQLVPASQVKSADLFLLEQDGTAKKLTGQTLENWLLSYADGHGGIQTIEKISTAGLVDTYRITFADESTQAFQVTNGKSVSSITQYFARSTSGTSTPTSWSTTKQELTATYKYLWTYIRFSFNDGTSIDTVKAVTGVYGDTGQQTYVHFKWSSVPNPTASDIGNNPDDYIGVYSGTSSTAPTSPSSYKWYQYRGAKGDPGDDAVVTNSEIKYQVSDSGSEAPTGAWESSIPTVGQGRYLWTQAKITFNTGSPIVFYSVTRWGIDGSGSVASVNSISPDRNGNVVIGASNIQTSSGKTVEEALTTTDFVRKVNDVSPDLSGNVTLTAISVGAAASVNNIKPSAGGNIALTADNIMSGSKSVTTHLNEIEAIGYVESKISDGGITAAMLDSEAVSKTYEGTLTTTWTGSAAPYTQTVAVTGIKATDNPIIDIVPSSTYATAAAQDAAWANVYSAVTGADTITFYAKAKTTVEVPFQALCIRK